MPEILFPNRATEKDVREQIDQELLPLLRHVRIERKPADSQWARWYRLWSAERDSGQAYNGRSKTYVATGRRIIEDWVQKVKRDLFPTNDDWFAVDAQREAFMKRVPGITALFHYFFSRHVHLRRQTTPFLRQLVTYGTSPVAISWRTDAQRVPTVQEELDETGYPTGKTKRVTETVLDYIGPTFRIVDLFAFYVWPTTVSDVNDATLAFEEQLISKQKLVAMGKVKGGDLKNLEEALELFAGGASGGKGADEKFQEERTRLSAKGFSSRMDAPGKSLHPVDLTQAYWRATLPGDTEPKLYRVTLAGDKVPLKVQENTYLHRRMPWLVGKFTEVNNEFYGRGVAETFDRLQYLLNDITDQANDALVWSMNPIAIINSYEVQDPNSIRMRPGAKWLATPDAVKFAEPPHETPAIGFAAASQFIGLMHDMGNSPILSGMGSGGGRNRGRALNTATGAQMVQGDNLVQVRDVVENIEDMVLVPMLRMTHALTLQCLTRPLTLRIAGRDGAPIAEQALSVADIVGDYDFRWLGSTNSQNQGVRVAQMIQMLQVIGQVPPEAWAAQNKKVNIPAIVETLWKDGMGLPHVERIIQDIQQITTMDARLENELFEAGRGEEVILSPADDDGTHLKIHDKLLGEHPDVRVKLLVTAHIAEHVDAIQQKAQQAQQAKMMQGMQALQQLLGGGGQQAPGGGEGNGLGIPAPNNPGRPPSTTEPQDLMRQMPR